MTLCQDKKIKSTQYVVLCQIVDTIKCKTAAISFTQSHPFWHHLNGQNTRHPPGHAPQAPSRFQDRESSASRLQDAPTTPTHPPWLSFQHGLTP